MATVTKKTNFELAMEQVKNGTLKTPSVSMNGTEIDYFKYQVVSHHFYLKIFANGMTAKNIKLKDIKTYYGLIGKTAKECLKDYETKMIEYGFKLTVKQ